MLFQVLGVTAKVAYDLRHWRLLTTVVAGTLLALGYSLVTDAWINRGGTRTATARDVLEHRVPQRPTSRCVAASSRIESLKHHADRARCAPSTDRTWTA